ncbi:uncharacterized protein LOC113214453 isoform X1 [Frankliniella occidentalis]|uniref:Uncharacterized protein LOC113214453 isoform X1 n=1 Tax=Frankliniella occidentalis TaxID=133901 RepID=A0A6J1TD13_FRAOC|nr:uncharacterized protein LOC113214453 isoform X1 [Frankliniella occidentalis]
MLGTMDHGNELVEPETELDQTGQTSRPFIQHFETPLDIRIASEMSLIFFDDIITCQFDNCSKMFTTSRNYRSHRAKFHRMSAYYCVICCAPYPNYNELVKHIVEDDHKIICPYCPEAPCEATLRKYSFSKPADAIIHYSNQHKQFLCVNCSTSFRGKIAFKFHVKNECHQDDENAAFAASSCVETSMNISFSETNPPPSSSDNNDVQIVEELQREPEELYLFTDLPDVHSSMAAENQEDNNSATDTAESNSLTGTGDMPESNAIETISPVDFETQLQGESYPDLEILNHCVMGSGGDELSCPNNITDFTPNISTISDIQEDNNQWIGHNVDMYADLSEKHKSTFKYTCRKCACSFRKEVLLRKHERTHEYACKYCSQRFNSLPEYRTHLKAHNMTDTHFPCSVCGHNCEGLKNLMIHEMHHRLNAAFKQEIENFANSSIGLLQEQNELECEICQERICGMSMWLRHKIWHRWVGMWTSYVLGRSFRGTFTVEDAGRLKHEVEAELIVKWRDCLKRKEIPSKRTNDKRPEDAGSSTVENQIGDDILDDTSTIPNSVAESENESDDEPESEGVSHAINGWMSYWQSYLGLDDNPPSWVKPILKELRSQWKKYHVNEQDLLYRQMDQLGVMIRAQKSGDLVSEGPWVLLQSNRPSVVPQKKGSIKSANRNSSSAHRVTSRARKSAPSSKPSIHSARFHSGSKVKRLTNLISKKRTPTLTKSPSHQSHANRDSKSGVRKTATFKRSRFSLPSCRSRLRSTHSKTGVENSPLLKQVRLSLPSRQCASAEMSLGQREVLEHNGSSSPNLQGESSTSNSQESCPTPLLQAVISLPRLKWPLQRSARRTRRSNIIGVRSSNANASLVLSPPSLSFEQTIHLIKSEISDHPIPQWAEQLIQKVCNNVSFTQTEKKKKIDQILSLLKSYYFHHMQLEPKVRPVVLLNGV